MMLVADGPEELVRVVLPESWFTFMSPNHQNLLDAALGVLAAAAGSTLPHAALMKRLAKGRWQAIHP
jgi:hypothetical protein